MSVISSSPPADISGLSVLTQRDASEIYRMIPETAFPTTDIDNMVANEASGVWSFVHYLDGVEQFTVQITNVTGNNYEWSITEPSLLLLESGFLLLLEGGDGAIQLGG